jgi:cation transport protein ChaC
MQDFWVFGYGSLMWRPGFPYVKRLSAHLYGLHRSLCIYSTVHRGTPQKPGLVLGLDRGGSCRGIAYQVALENIEETISYLRKREQVTKVYHEVTRPIRIHDKTDRVVPALIYIVDRTHKQYAGRLSPEAQVEFVRQGIGISGVNPEYVHSSVEHLKEMGVRDRPLERLDSLVKSKTDIGKKDCG